MDLEVRAFDECGLGPLSSLDAVVRFDMAIDFPWYQWVLSLYR